MSSRRLSRIEQLPNELLVRIRSYLRRPTELLKFGLSSRKIWSSIREDELFLSDAIFYQLNIDVYNNVVVPPPNDTYEFSFTASTYHGLPMTFPDFCRAEPEEAFKGIPALLWAIVTDQPMGRIGTIIDVYKRTMTDPLNRALHPDLLSPLALATQYDRPMIMEMLIDEGADINACMQFFRNGRWVSWHVNRDMYEVDPEYQDMSENYMLGVACQTRQQAAGRYLLGRGAEVSARDLFRNARWPAPRVVADLLQRELANQSGRAELILKTLRFAAFFSVDGNTAVIDVVLGACGPEVMNNTALFNIIVHTLNWQKLENACHIFEVYLKSGFAEQATVAALARRLVRGGKPVQMLNLIVEHWDTIMPGEETVELDSLRELYSIAEAP